MSLEESFGGDERLGRLAAIRGSARHRRLVVLAGILLGLGLGSIHWFGLVLGGAVAALPATSVTRGLGYGLALGVIELVFFAGMLAWQGALGPALTTGTVGVITVAIGLVAPVLGALVRGIV